MFAVMEPPTCFLSNSTAASAPSFVHCIGKRVLRDPDEELEEVIKREGELPTRTVAYRAAEDQIDEELEDSGEVRVTKKPSRLV